MIFHLAIPAENLERSSKFYVKLGGIVARAHDTHVVLDFFGHQLVLQKSDEIDFEPKMYPRHFGIVFKTEDDLDRIYRGALIYPKELFQEMFTRSDGKVYEHKSFFVRDPSNNLIEFKFYKNGREGIF